MKTNNKTLLTKEGFRNLLSIKSKLELSLRKAKDRRAQLMAEKEFMSVDLSDVQSEIFALQKELAQISTQLDNAKLLPASTKKHSHVQVGDNVRIVNHVIGHQIKLVSTYEANPLEGKVSVKSPIGKQVIGKAIGSTINVVVPRFGQMEFQIAGIL